MDLYRRVLESPQGVLAYEPEAHFHTGAVNCRYTMFLTAGATALAADCSGSPFAIEALRISAHSFEVGICAWII